MPVHRFIVCICACGLLLGSVGNAADPATEGKPETVTLLGMLGEWRYPDAKFHGAKMSDAAVKDISSVKCQARLTTPDSMEKVLAYYQDKLKVDSEENLLGSDNGERMTSERAVVIQDDSDGREVKLTIIHVHAQRSSTTLAISRSQGEKVTHIAWTHFRQVWPE